MDARFYNSEEIDLEKLATDLENIFRAQGYETQQINGKDQFGKDQLMVQMKKGGDLAALVGLQTALSVSFQHTTGGVVAMIGQQKWIDKAVVGGAALVAAPFIPILWPLLVTAGVGAAKQASLGGQVLSTVDALVHQQRPEAQAGPLPGTLMPQYQQYWAPPPAQYTQPYAPQTPVYVPPTPVYTPPAPAKPRCPSCNTSYEPGDTFCSGCGRALTPPKNLCPSCKAEVKPGVAFCPKCGANTFQATTSQPARPAAPTYTPTTPATPVYTPTTPATPVYTPPKQPPTPVYKSPTPVYTPTQHSAPTIPAKPEPYVPPTPQEPPVVPQPSVTLIPGKPKSATPTPPPPSPPTPVYIPPAPLQPPTVVARAQPAQPPTMKQIQSKPAGEPATDPNEPWGTLTFDNGNEVMLAGERVLVGRYDHDLGGVQPEVDLGTYDGADTVSRGHATIEHIGSTYQLTDLNSTNLTRINGKRIDAGVPTAINDGDTLQFGKIQCTFKKS